jgi:hypothetical protein
MRLRSGRAPVTRLSRKVIVVLALILAVAIAAALFLALRPGLKIDRAEPRSNIVTPSSSSRRMMRLLIVDALTPSDCAAPEKLPVSTAIDR